MGVKSSSFEISRRQLLLTGALGLTACATPATARPKTVLFVCQYGTVKSPTAREHFRRLAAARGIVVEVRSRGITPEDHVAPQLLEALADEGIDIRSEPVRTLALADLAAADIIIIFDPMPERFGAWPVRDWGDTPSMNQEYAAARAVLVPRLEALLRELA